MLRTLLSGSAFASAGGGDAVGVVFNSGVGSSGGATEARGEVWASGSGGGVSWTRSGCCMTRVTSLESSATQSGAASLDPSSPQSVSISSVDGGVDGNTAGALLVRRGGTEDDKP